MDIHREIGPSVGAINTEAGQEDRGLTKFFKSYIILSLIPKQKLFMTDCPLTRNVLEFI